MKQSLVEMDMRILNDASRGLAILCLSAPRNSIPMWSYYANSHKGVAIGVAMPNVGRRLPGRFAPVKYRKRRRAVDPWLLPPSRKWYDQVTDTILTKSRVWQHEQEHRRIVRLQDTMGPFPDQDGKPMHFVSLDGGDIREVVFGCSMKPEDEARIRAELNERPAIFRHVKLFRCERHRSRFELTIVPAD